MNGIIENNQVTISGEIISDFQYSHAIYGEKFCIADLSSMRISGQSDIIPIMVSDRLVSVNENWKGQIVKISGQFRSYNKHEETKNRLMLSVFTREFEVWTNEGDRRPNDENSIFLDGYICKEPIYRKTPLGREIADLLLAVNRPYGKSDYIPCICWGRNARFASNFSVGTRCEIWGRIQSREYMKRLSEDDAEKRIAYEVSVSKLELSEQ